MVLDEAADGDEVVEVAGVKVIVDPMSLRYLEGAEVDYKEDLMGGGFAIKNPNATSTCGCGHSFNAGAEGAGGGHHHCGWATRRPASERPPRRARGPGRLTHPGNAREASSRPSPAVPPAQRRAVPADADAPARIRAALSKDGDGRPGQPPDHRHDPPAAGVGGRLPGPTLGVRPGVRGSHRAE